MAKKYNGTVEEDNIGELNDAFFANALPLKAALPDLHAAWKRSRGRPKKDNPKREVKIRLDPDVLDAFRANGKGWQTRMNEVLRDWVKQHPA